VSQPLGLSVHYRHSSADDQSRKLSMYIAKWSTETALADPRENISNPLSHGVFN
jgi:hypothetical protein